MSKRRSKVFYGSVMVNADGGILFAYDIPDDMPTDLSGELTVYDNKLGKWVRSKGISKGKCYEANRRAIAHLLRNFAVPKPGEKARVKFTIQLED